MTFRDNGTIITPHGEESSMYLSSDDSTGIVIDPQGNLHGTPEAIQEFVEFAKARPRLYEKSSVVDANAR